MNEETKQKSATKRLGEQVVGVFGWVKNQWQTNPLPSILVVIVLLLLVWITWETDRLGNLGLGDKTYWDWMELLIIPIVLAIGAWWLNKSERENEREIAERNREEDREIARQNRQQDREIADERREEDRRIADDRRNQATLEAYFDRMAELLLEKGLRESKEGDEVRSIARTRTLAVLRSLDSDRKGQVVQFLYESGLIGPKLAVVLLNGANLSKAFLVGANLFGTNLSESDLSGANLSGANLSRTNLSRAKLTGAILTGANLSQTNLERANLSLTDLSRADLRDANLTRANLRGADLSGTDLSEADLNRAKVTNEQLAQAASLAGATLPDGARLSEENWRAEFDEWRNEQD